ncbi:hypothetical protein BJX70DRAFT_409203 [Aspergillus crustosus]
MPAGNMRGQKACIRCYNKKIKCDARKNGSCGNCTQAGAQCICDSEYNQKPLTKTQSGGPKKHETRSKSRRNTSAQLNPALARDLDTINQLEDTAADQHQSRSKFPHYFSFHEAMVTPRLAEENPNMSRADLALLRDQGAFTFPTDNVQHELVATFMEYGHVWTPVLDPAWLTGIKPSFLLVQAIFVAASKLTSQPNEHGLSSDFYRRAKLLFFFGIERDPLVSIASAVLLHWYAPVGIDVSETDTTAFWLRTAESIALQVGLHKEPKGDDPQGGLRRRLWWTLVHCDCIQSASAGQPRLINLLDSDVKPPAMDDFPDSDDHARVFPVHVSICHSLGDTVERCLRQELTATAQRTLEDSLFRWFKQDFRSIATPVSDSLMEARQILVIYLANLIILDRALSPDGLPPTRSLLAASFIAGLFRQFLEANELCRLGPSFTFYALCAGLMLTPAAWVLGLRISISEDMLMLKVALQILSRQWGSAFSALHALQNLEVGSIPKQAPIEEVPRASSGIPSFFEGLDTKWCRLWGPIVDGDGDQTMAPAPELKFHDFDMPGSTERAAGIWILDNTPFAPAT